MCTEHVFKNIATVIPAPLIFPQPPGRHWPAFLKRSSVSFIDTTWAYGAYILHRDPAAHGDVRVPFSKVRCGKRSRALISVPRVEGGLIGSRAGERCVLWIFCRTRTQVKCLRGFVSYDGPSAADAVTTFARSFPAKLGLGVWRARDSLVQLRLLVVASSKRPN